MIPSSYINIFIGAIIAGVAAIIIACLKSWLTKRVKFTGPTAEAIADQARQLAVQQRLVIMLVDLAKPQLLALLNILDALKDKMNGDFERANKGIREALDSYDKTMKDIITDECNKKGVA